MNFIKFHWVECKNLASVGNMPIRIQLDKSPTTVVLGNNGAGKSSLILDSVCFGLFGKPFRGVTKNQLVNNKNGRNLLVKIEFTRGSDKILVVRGIKPNVFEIHVNDKLVDQSSKSRDYQKYFEEVILGIDYVTFTQIVMIGKANYVPFMALNAGARRNFVERVLGLDVFRAMAEVHKQNVDSLSKDVAEYKASIRIAGERIKSQERIITHIEETSRKTADEKRATLESEIAALREEVDKLTATKALTKQELDSLDIKSVKEQATKHSQAITDIRDLLSQIESNRTITNRELTFFEKNDVCPTCTQLIDKHFRDESIAKRRQRNQQFEKSISELTERLNAQEAASKEAASKIDRARQLLSSLQALDKDITAKHTRITTLTAELDSVTIQHHNLSEEQQTLADLKKELADTYTRYNETSEELKYLDFMTLCLKDSGIKSTIINEYIPTINNIVNQNIKQLGLFATVRLDDQFNEEIKIRGFEAMTYNQLSEGEKLRLDMAIMMAWRDVARLKSNMSSNLLIMDEIFDSSVDAEGTTAFADLLKTVSNLNVFVITHTPEKLADSFRSFIRLEKVNGFTTLSQSGNY